MKLLIFAVCLILLGIYAPIVLFELLLVVGVIGVIMFIYAMTEKR